LKQKYSDENKYYTALEREKSFKAWHKKYME
jgi:hypothetical protein